jgi:CheY-like chemotaxis protein
MARRHRPQLITLDPELPRKNGWETLRTVRTDPELRSTAIAVVNSGAVEMERVASEVKARATSPESKVLVVDSDATTRELITGQLAAGVAEVQTAAGGHAGLDVLERWAPDLLVLTMPSDDAIAFLATVRRHHRHADLPVVIVTRTAGAHGEGTSPEAGAVTILGREVDVEQGLGAMLQGLVGPVPPAP